MHSRIAFRIGVLTVVGSLSLQHLPTACAQRVRLQRPNNEVNPRDAKHTPTGQASPTKDPAFEQHGIYAQSAPRPPVVEPVATVLPLELQPGDRIALVGNTLLEREQLFGHLETLLQQRFPDLRLTFRNLAWSGDAIDWQPRPENFADLEQHLHHERADVVLAAYGFNESFAGEEGLPAFRKLLGEYVARLKSRAYNGRSAPRVVLISPIASEDAAGVKAAQANNHRLQAYVAAMQAVAAEQRVGFVDAFSDTLDGMATSESDLTVNGVHLNAQGNLLFARTVYRGLTGETAPEVNESLRQLVVDKDRQFFRRYRPVNSFYYTGGRRGDYGYLDFLPAMRNFEQMVENRDAGIQALAGRPPGEAAAFKVDDSNVPALPPTDQSRGANEWLSAADEQAAFQLDPRFEVNLFAGEEQFPEIANPIQMRWDNRGRLWVSCSTTYPHVYPGQEPNDKLVILEDQDGDGRADKSTVFAENLHIPLSFELGHGGVFVSEQPTLTFLKDTNGDDKADERIQLLSGFGTEDSHHALHDFVWTPDGDLLIRESIFHHSQIETPYGPIRQQNSGWFRFEPRTQRLTSFGTYPSTNPWGVTFDDWGQHVASHPIFAAAFHAPDPPYPQQHPAPKGLRAYSGTCGHDFVDWATFPDELQGGFIKARYKPTNRIEIHQWIAGEFGYDEEYVGDLLFSTNLSFIPVDVGFGPRGDFYICDWYNPVKGHAQYSLRDERRDRHSGRIWRITAKGRPLQEPPRIADASIPELLDLLKRPEYRVRYWAKRELRDRNVADVRAELDRWVANLAPAAPRHRHHQLEGVWIYRGIGAVNSDLLRELLRCDDHHARAAAVQQLRYWHPHLPDAIALLHNAINDPNGIVRMEAAIAASHIGSREAFAALLEVFNHPRGGHLEYAVTCALGSHMLRPYWESDPTSPVPKLLQQATRRQEFQEPTPGAGDAQFDSQPNLQLVRVSTINERMKFTVEQFAVTVGQPVKLVFTNPDATDHNLVIVQQGALEEVGLAGNEMAKDPRNANSDFIPAEKRPLILEATPMIGPTRKSQVAVLRFKAPQEPGIYPYVCTFPGHWIVMNGEMVVGKSAADIDAMLAARQPKIVRAWTVSDFADVDLAKLNRSEATVMRGMQAFQKARCSQCHVVAGVGFNMGPDLTDVAKRFQGEKLLRQILEPSAEIHEKFRTMQFLMLDGRVIAGVVKEEQPGEFQVITNLLAPDAVTRLKRGEVDQQAASKVSAMPESLVNVLTKEELVNLLSYLEAGGLRLHDAAGHGHER
jgi:putative heme-binding domain-containing protein